jgi:hypothetical protein
MDIYDDPYPCQQGLLRTLTHCVRDTYFPRNTNTTYLWDTTLAARRDGQHFDCATWLHKARQMPKEDFKKEVEKELTGRETEPWEIIYFKLYQSQMPVIEKAIETAALMLGSDGS